MNQSDFLTVQEAIELINTDTATNPTVDHKALTRGVEYLKTNMRGGEMNYTIHLLGRNDKGEIIRTGVKYVRVTSSRDASQLEWAIVDHYKQLSGKQIDADKLGLSAQTTAYEEGKKSVARVNAESKISFGDDIPTEAPSYMQGGKS